MWSLVNVVPASHTHLNSQVRVAAARATSVALMSANLRRSLNNDLRAPTFRQHLSRYLTEFAKLVPESWSSIKELQSYTTGMNLNIMFADRTEEQATILLADPATRGGGNERNDEGKRDFVGKLAHLMTIAKKGNYYAVPLMGPQQTNQSHTDFVCFQLLGFRPGNKKYMQRLTNWSTDVWRGALLCSTLGIFSAPKLDADNTALVQRDVTAAFSSSNVQPWSVESLFQEDRVDHMYEFQRVHHEVAFDTSAIEDMNVDAESDSFEYDMDFVTLGMSLNIEKSKNIFVTDSIYLKSIYIFNIYILHMSYTLRC